MKPSIPKSKNKTHEEDLHGSSVYVVDAFLQESNHIESEYSKEAFEDAKAAWKYIEKLKTISSKDVLEIHRILMNRLRPDIAGKWRDCAVSIGGKRKQAFSSDMFTYMVKNCLLTMDTDLPWLEEEGKEKHAQICHVLFENIHPFEDGNGRVGRILYNWHRIQLGLPIHVIHADWPEKEGQQASYYKWFQNS